MEYHAGIERITSSGLKLLLNKSPAHYYAKYAEEAEEVPTRAMVLGSLTHALILEGEDVATSRYGIAPANPGTKAYANWLAGDPDLEGGVKEEDWDAARRMRDSVMGIHEVRLNLEGSLGVAEQVIEWTDPILQVDCKCKPDWLAHDSSLMIDLKTSRDASQVGFERAVRNFGYDLSAAFYLQGAAASGGTPAWQWLVVESEPPYAAVIYDIAENTLQYGEARVSAGLEIYAQCIAEGAWPSYPRTAI